VIIIVIITLTVLAGTAFFLVGYLKPKPGGILVEASNISDVYIDGQFVGKTPYTGLHQEGQVTLKVGAYETMVNIVSGIQTVVRSGEILYFDRSSQDSAPMKISTDPKDAQILIDGTVKGFAPYETSGVTAAQHILTVRAPGFIDKVESIRNIMGYKLNIFIKLAKAPEVKKEEPPKVFVEVLKTPNDFLRIREGADTTSKELERAKTGELLLVLDDTVKGWYKVQKDADDGTKIEGYISAEFAKIATSN